MAALVPLNRSDALPRLHEAGVAEVYVGFHDDAWDERFGEAELNRMSGFGQQANPFDFVQMCDQLGQARQLGMRAFVCFNAAAYTPAQISFIRHAYIPALAQAGASGVICASQALIGPAREAGVDAVVSTVSGVFNARLAAYYRACGATRIIVPRDLSLDEIEGIVRAVSDVEYEVFLMRNGCMFSDSHCLGCHRAGKPSLCLSLRSGDWAIDEVEGAGGFGAASVASATASSTAPFAGVGNSDTVAIAGAIGAGAAAYASGATATAESPLEGGFIDRARYNEWLLNEHYHRRTCGLCALWRFEQLGIAAYKVVGRGDDLEDLVADAGLVVRNAALARNCATQAEYHQRMELPRDPSTLCGMNSLSCYYPECTRAKSA